MIKRVEINYRGIFQKNLGKKIGSDIVIIASRMGRIGFSNGRYSDSPERNGIPCKYFAFVSHDLSEEELEAECGAKLDIDQADISVVLDDTMTKGVEPWGCTESAQSTKKSNQAERFCYRRGRPRTSFFNSLGGNRTSGTSRPTKAMPVSEACGFSETI